VCFWGGTVAAAQLPKRCPATRTSHNRALLQSEVRPAAPFGSTAAGSRGSRRRCPEAAAGAGPAGQGGTGEAEQARRYDGCGSQGGRKGEAPAGNCGPQAEVAQGGGLSVAGQALRAVQQRYLHYVVQRRHGLQLVVRRGPCGIGSRQGRRQGRLAAWAHAQRRAGPQPPSPLPVTAAPFRRRLPPGPLQPQHYPAHTHTAGASASSTASPPHTHTQAARPPARLHPTREQLHGQAAHRPYVRGGGHALQLNHLLGG
jgi:hypothetical protein